MNRNVAFVLLLLVGVLVVSSPRSASSYEDWVIQSTYGVPAIDGVVSDDEWPQWTTIQIPIDDAFGPDPPLTQDVSISAQNTAALLTIAAQIHGKRPVGRHTFSVSFIGPAESPWMFSYDLIRHQDGSIEEVISAYPNDPTYPYGNASFKVTEPDGNGTYTFEMAFPITLIPRVPDNYDVLGLRPSSNYSVLFDYCDRPVALYCSYRHVIVCAVDPVQSVLNMVITAVIITVPVALIVVFGWIFLRRRRKRRAAG